MDLISHALWSSALFKYLNLRSKKKNKFNLWKAAIFGMFPDIVSFVIPSLIILPVLILKNGFNVNNLTATLQTPSYTYIIELLYNISHSLVIFAIVFMLILLIFKKPIWILFGWLLHILIDIPTHLLSHFPTPMFWPISNFKINGIIYWREPLFMVIDIVLLTIVWFIILKIEKR